MRKARFGLDAWAVYLAAGHAAPPRSGPIDGFSLHARVRVEAHDRKRLEQLCRCIARPAHSDQRVQLNPAGQVELKRKTLRRGSTTHLVLRRDKKQSSGLFAPAEGPELCEGAACKVEPAGVHAAVGGAGASAAVTTDKPTRQRPVASDSWWPAPAARPTAEAPGWHACTNQT